MGKDLQTGERDLYFISPYEIINELKQKITDKIILSATKFIKFSSQNVLSPTYSKLNEFHGGRNPVHLS